VLRPLRGDGQSRVRTPVARFRGIAPQLVAAR
jgi:hypothetical protein